MDLTCYILIALALVLGFIGGWSLWFAVVRYWERRAKAAEGDARELHTLLEREQQLTFTMGERIRELEKPPPPVR